MNSVKKIMIIDDSLLDIHLVERILEINNYDGELIKAESISNAITAMTEWVKRYQPMPDLILLDMFYPTETAIDFLDYFESIDESLRKEVKIAVISATKLLFDNKSILNRPNVIRVLNKPFTYSQISDLIKL